MSSLSTFFKRLLTPARKREAANKMYAAIVAQARQTDFYARFLVPDTVDGRFDMIVLHVYLALARLRAANDACTDLQMMVQEAMFADLDRSLREMGVGDVSVGKHIKDMASAYFGRLSAYDAALESGEALQVEEVLARNVWRGGPIPGEDNARKLATYVLIQKEHLAKQDSALMCSGVVSFLAPDATLTANTNNPTEQEVPG